MRPIALALSLLFASAVLAQPPTATPDPAPPTKELDPVPPVEGFAPVPEPPPLPDPVESGEVLEPEVRIILRDGVQIEEFRINHQLYMVRITPRVGRPYYLVDTTGDGRLDTRRHELEPDLQVPQWILFSW
jgi:hypothetical protein